jgi:hypothetical protein
MFVIVSVVAETGRVANGFPAGAWLPIKSNKASIGDRDLTW